MHIYIYYARMIYEQVDDIIFAQTALENGFKMVLYYVACCRMFCKISCVFVGLQDELWSNCPKKIKLDPSVSVNGGISGSTTTAALADVNNGGVSEMGIRRSARNRRPRGELRLKVSSNDTLLDLKMKVILDLNPILHNILKNNWTILFTTYTNTVCERS